ncbi:hypothetical protein V7S43_005314 [Phytophthora oleae]|uniref:Uncharacterized protein n=1 Tax=Phytophthora oleae TaxID=2107226 RepID=A0ABD3FW25_9STRA
MSDNSDPATPSNVHLSRDDYRIIVTWMEVPANFQTINGKTDKTSSGEKPKVKKKDAFKALARHLIKRTSNPSLQVLSGRNMQQRWRTYLQRFNKTLKASKTGLELSRVDARKGILSVPEKLEVMCPQFSRMKVLFGENFSLLTEKPNARASATIELGAPFSLNQEDHRDEKSCNSGDSDSDSDEDCSDVGATSAEFGENGGVASAIATQAQVAPSSSASTDRLTMNELLTPEPSKEPSASPRQETMTSAQERHSPSRQQWSGAKRTPSSSNSHSKRQKNADTERKTQRQTVHEAHHSLSAASAKDDYRYLVQKLEEEKRQWNEKIEVEKALWEADFDFRQRELEDLRAEREEETRRWDEKHKAEKLQREAEAEYRRLELDEQRAKRQHELLLELLRQKKSVEYISTFMGKFG